MPFISHLVTSDPAPAGQLTGELGSVSGCSSSSCTDCGQSYMDDVLESSTLRRNLANLKPPARGAKLFTPPPCSLSPMAGTVKPIMMRQRGRTRIEERSPAPLQVSNTVRRHVHFVWCVRTRSIVCCGSGRRSFPFLLAELAACTTSVSQKTPAEKAKTTHPQIATQTRWVAQPFPTQRGRMP